jgi:organic radical activating enzyme
MFGKNPVRHRDAGDGSSLWVQSVFYTLQGEGPLAGRPSVFVRLAGCNLRCWFCDTDFESSTWRPTLDELVAEIDRVRRPFCKLIVLTGGEPFRQNIAPFVCRLLDAGLQIQIETNGTLWVELPESPALMIICSPKTPRLDRRIVPRISAYKYVVGSGEVSEQDGLPNASMQRLGQTSPVARPPADVPVYVMPRDDRDAQANASNQQVCVDAAMTFGYTLTTQLHKSLGIE